VDGVTICPVCGANPESRWFCRRCGAAQRAALEQPLPERPSQRRGRWKRWLLGGTAVAMIACTVLIVLAALSFDPAALILAFAAAAIPAVFYSSLVLRLDRYEREPLRAVLAAFGWGAVAAVLLALVLEIATGSVLLAAIGNQDAADVLTAVIGAPLIEETTKGVALLGLLWFFRDEFDDVLDGLIYGALIGLGFAMTENILYLGSEYLDGGAAALGQLFVARVVIDGFGHAIYTATTGAAVGWFRSNDRRGDWRYLVPVVGWSLAVLQHALWNGSLLVIGGMFGSDVPVVKVVLLQAPIFTLPALIVLLVIARIAGKKELAIMREQLAPEVAGGVLTPHEYEVLTTDELRKSAIQEASRTGGRERRDRQQRFFQAAAELAFRKYHLSRGERPAPGQESPEDAYRAELALLRSQMSAGPAVAA
jgi:RsiW-degrading membrane proteinase PrsW (M82 family)